MPLTRPPAPDNWERWQQANHQMGNGCVMVETPGMVHYESRVTAPAPWQQRPPVTSSPYMMDNSYCLAPMTNMPHGHYPPQNAFDYSSYTPPTPATPAIPSFRKCEERQDDCIPYDHIDRAQRLGYHADGLSSYTTEQTISPVVKSEAQMPTQRSPIMFHQTAKPRMLTLDTSMSGVGHQQTEYQTHGKLPIRMNPKSKTNQRQATIVANNQIEFHTEVDELMGVLKKADRPASPTSSSMTACKSDSGSSCGIAAPPSSSDDGGDVKGGKIKKFRCDAPGCRQRFSKRTHLEIHMRIHNGEKPYECCICGNFFSQAGNLKTHERRHTGERPFECDFPGCTSKFPQRGNLRAHKQIHNPTKKFFCRLGNCEKSFGQRGNLKTHQNKFHKDILVDLTSKIATMDVDDRSPEVLDVVKYLKDLYKNSCQGIKGRGHNRKVNFIKPTNTYAVKQHTPPMSLIPHHVPHLPPPMQHYHHGLVEHDGLPHFPLPRNGPTIPRTYGMWEVDQDSSSSSSTADTIYEEDRNMGFPDRMY